MYSFLQLIECRRCFSHRSNFLGVEKFHRFSTLGWNGIPLPDPIFIRVVGLYGYLKLDLLTLAYFVFTCTKRLYFGDTARKEVARMEDSIYTPNGRSNFMTLAWCLHSQVVDTARKKAALKEESGTGKYSGIYCFFPSFTYFLWVLFYLYKCYNTDECFCTVFYSW